MNKTKLIQIRVTEKQKEIIKEKAEEKQMKIPEYIRMILLK